MTERPATPRSPARIALWGALALLAWIAVSRWGVPAVIEAAYRGEGPRLLTGLLAGRDVHSLEHYLEAWRSLSRTLSVSVLAVGVTGFLLSRLPTGGGLLAGDTPEPDPRTRTWVVGGALVLAVAVCLACGPGRVPLLGDNQHYFYMSVRVADGVPPHVSNFDPKASLSLLLTGAAVAAGRVVGIGDVLSARLLSVAALAAGTALLAAFTWRWTRHVGASLVAALLPLGLVHLPLLAASGSRPKVFLVLFAAASLFFAASSRWMPAVLAATLGFLTWQPALLLLGAALAAHLAAGNRDFGRWARLAGGGVLLPIALYEAYFLATGALGEQLAQEVLFPARYMTSGFEGALASARSLAGIWSSGYSPELAGVELGPPLLALGALSGLTLALYAWRHRRRLPDAAARPGVVYLAAGAAGTAAFTYYDHQGPPDLFFVIPFAVPLVAAAVGVLASGLRRRLGRAAEHALVGVVAAMLLAAAAAGVREARALDVTLADQRRAAERVGAWVEDGRGVYAVGSTHLLALNRAPNWLPYSFFFRGVDAWLTDRTAYVRETGAGPAFRPERRGRLPGVVLTSRAWPVGWPGWLERRYRSVTAPVFERQGVEVWRRRGGPDLPGGADGSGGSPAGRPR